MIRRGAALLASVLLGLPGLAASPDLGTEAEREAGKKLYDKLCSQCHGETGDGVGPASAHLLPKPRDFTRGKYKIRTTPSGALPTHADLVNIIRRGMPYTSMPPWPQLSKEQLSSLAHYLKTFSSDFANPELVPQAVALPKAPGRREDAAEAGPKAYEEAGCVQCHGALGRGDGTSAPTLVDDWGNPLRPADLTQSWTFRGGSTREDIFRTMSTGLNGTPMPSYGEALNEEQRWAIVDWIDGISNGGRPGYANLVTARRIFDPIDLERASEIFEGAPEARFPIVGQIMEPGRSFHPPATSVLVQAVYDAESVAFRVRWHDMSAQTSGKNAPDLPVPIEEEKGAAPAGEAPASDDPWGDDVWGEAAAPAEEAAGDDFWGEETAAPSGGGSEFSDAVAIQLPAKLPTGARKPYFLFGDEQNAVDLWFLDLAKSRVEQYTGRGSGNLARNDSGEVEAIAAYDRGEWTVVFRRPLRSTSGVRFAPGTFVPMAFSVWDGHTRERGNRRGLTLWYDVWVEPEEVPSPVGPMARIALLILGAEIAAIVWIRRRHGRNEESPAAG